MASNWKLWVQQYGWFEVATQLNKKSEEIQVATFMSCIAFELSEDDRGKKAPINDKFKQYFTPKANTTYDNDTLSIN